MRNKVRKNNAPDATDTALRRLVRAPETAHQIYDLAESLYHQRAEDAARISLADIERIGEYLREIDADSKRIKKQFADLAGLEGGFEPAEIPIGF